MKRISLIAILIGLAGIAYAQSHDETCSAEVYTKDEFNDLPWVGNNAWLPRYLDSVGYTGNTFNYEDALYRIPVFLWIYQEKNARRGHVGPQRIKKYITNLNYFYTKNNTGIVFYLQGYEKLGTGNHKKMGYYLEGPVQSIKNRSKGAINVYVVDKIKKVKSYLRGTYNSITNSVFIQKNASSSTLSHEVGHYLGLLHPHENWDKGKCKAEAADRSRKLKGCFKSGLICEHNGDGLCDTPAEPNLQRYTTNDCKFFADHLKDPWGDSYKPATNNIMSYTKYRDCREHFTKGQIAVMLKTAAEDKHAHAWKTESGVNRRFKFDASEPDDIRKMATSIKLNAPYYFSFHNIYSPDNKQKKDHTDWVKFEIENKTSIKITTEKAKYRAPMLKLELFDESKKPVMSSGTQKFPSLKKNLPEGIYWLKISNHRKMPRLYDYQLQIQQ